jgi:hypothetical protein
MITCLMLSTDAPASISPIVRRVRGLSSHSFGQIMSGNICWAHTSPLLHSGSFLTTTPNLSNDFFTIPNTTCGCRKKTRIGIILSSSNQRQDCHELAWSETRQACSKKGKEARPGQRQHRTGSVSLRKTGYTRMEQRIMVFIPGFLAGSGKHLDRIVLAWSRRHSNSHA